MRTQRRTPEEQLEMVRLCRASGLTIAEWWISPYPAYGMMTQTLVMKK